MNFITDWIIFLRNDLETIGLKTEAIPQELIPQYYLAVLDKLKYSQERKLTLSLSELGLLDELTVMTAAGDLANKCRQEILANETYLKNHEQSIHNSLLKQCPELQDEPYIICLKWKTWDECELVWQFTESKIALKELLKLKLN